MNMRSGFLFLSLFAFIFNLSILADIPLPFPDPIEETVSEADPNPETNPIGEAGLAAAPSSPEDKGERNLGEATEGEKPALAEAAPKSIVSRSTKLPNVNDRKEKKSSKKKEDQDPSKAAYERGLLRLRNGQKDAAKEEFSKAASTEGSSTAQAKLELSKLGESKGSETASEAVADDSIWKTSLETARSFRAQGKNSEAESILLRVATEGGNEFKSRALLQLGDLLFRQGRYTDSRSYLIDFWNRFGKSFPVAEDPNTGEFKSQREEKELGAYLLFKASYKAGEGEWAKRFLKKYLDKTQESASNRYSPLRSEMEALSRSDL